jgi:MFS family permease
VRRLAFSRGVTYFGGNAAFVATTAVVYEKTGSLGWVAAVVFASFAVPALVSPIAGAVGDRFDRRTVMVSSELGGALCFAAMALVSGPAALLGLRVLASLAAAPLVPATAAALPNLARSDQQLSQANAQLEIAGRVGAVAGPLVAGVLLTTVGAGSVFLLNAATFLASAILIVTIRANFQGGRGGTSPADLVAGLRVVFGHPLLRPVALAYGLIFLGIGVTAPAEIALSEDIFAAGPLGFSALLGLWGLGGVLGAHVAGRIAPRSNRTVLLGAAGLGWAVGFFIVGGAPVFAVALAGMAVGGAFEGCWQVTQGFMIQRSIPDHLRSRAFASIEAVNQLGVAVGLVFCGLAVSAVGVRGVFAIAGVGCLSAAAILSLPRSPSVADQSPTLALPGPAQTESGC